MKDILLRKKAILKRLEHCSSFVRGSINSVCAKCNRAKCVCEKKIKSKRAYRLTYKDLHQKTKIVYIPQGKLPEIKTMIANYAKARRVMEELVELNLEIFKNKEMP